MTIISSEQKTMLFLTPFDKHGSVSTTINIRARIKVVVMSLLGVLNWAIEIGSSGADRNGTGASFILAETKLWVLYTCRIYVTNTFLARMLHSLPVFG